MSISLQCSGCGKKLTTKDEFAGKRVKCPGCGQVILVAAASDFQPAPELPQKVEQQVDPAILPNAQTPTQTQHPDVPSTAPTPPINSASWGAVLLLPVLSGIGVGIIVFVALTICGCALAMIAPLPIFWGALFVVVVSILMTAIMTVGYSVYFVYRAKRHPTIGPQKIIARLLLPSLPLLSLLAGCFITTLICGWVWSTNEPLRWSKVERIALPSRSRSDLKMCTDYLRDFPEGAHVNEVRTKQRVIEEERQLFEDRVDEFRKIALSAGEPGRGKFRAPYYFLNKDGSRFTYALGGTKRTETFADARTLVVCETREFVAGHYLVKGNDTGTVGYGNSVTLYMVDLDAPSVTGSLYAASYPPSSMRVRQVGNALAEKNHQQLVFELLQKLGQ